MAPTPVAPFNTGIQLSYPGLSWYWHTYGTPENPNAGKEALVKDIHAISAWGFPTPPETPSVGLFQQLPSSWGSSR